MTLRVQSIGFIGAGRLAASLSAALQEAGYPVTAVASRNTQSAATLSSALGGGVKDGTAASVAGTCDLVFLTVADAEISALSAGLPWRAEQAVVHCSGALDLAVLDTASNRGALAGCLHPLQSFPSRSPEPARFGGIFCGIEAPAPLAAYLEDAARATGARSFRLEGVDRSLYHAAAVFASNEVVALMAAASRLWGAAGLPETTAREALSPLLLASAANVARQPLAQALTGPVARGDVATVRRHLAALEGEPELARLYRALSAELLRLELGHSPEIARQLAALLHAEPE